MQTLFKFQVSINIVAHRRWFYCVFFLLLLVSCWVERLNYEFRTLTTLYCDSNVDFQHVWIVQKLTFSLAHSLSLSFSKSKHLHENFKTDKDRKCFIYHKWCESWWWMRDYNFSVIIYGKVFFFPFVKSKSHTVDERDLVLMHMNGGWLP